ncbi:MAG: DUF4931 domain-containing protein [Coriobacteriaceae bacterium]|nr:DUF4931 domain-containing protein [Coriobacteriaceae bacterium]
MPLIFESAASRGKPDDNRRPTDHCPFCDVGGLQDVLLRERDRIWLMNKYRTLADTVQTVIIESADHDGDLSRYPRRQAREVVRFALSCWDAMAATGAFRSVLMYKNFGPLSGGSLHHPHLQVVGLVGEDGYAEVSEENLGGMPVWKRGDVAVSVSTDPVMGFFEVNVAMEREGAGGCGCGDGADVGGRCGDGRSGANVTAVNGADDALDADDAVDIFADAIAATARYLLKEHHGGQCTSYNLFFYPLPGRVVCKVAPRWVASPYFVGYRLSQVDCAAKLESDAADLRRYLEG